MSRPGRAALALALLLAAAPTPALAVPVPVPPPPPERPSADKSIAFYVGKNRTDNGSTLLGGFGHEPSGHWLEIAPRQQHPQGATITVGATDEADLPGRLTQIPQVPETAKYITSNYSEFAGFPAPLTNGGLNEHGVAARDVWSDSRPELVAMTPPGQTGPNYSDLSKIRGSVLIFVCGAVIRQAGSVRFRLEGDHRDRRRHDSVTGWRTGSARLGWVGCSAGQGIDRAGARAGTVMM